MGRKKLTEEERAIRDAEKAELLSTRKKYNVNKDKESNFNHSTEMNDQQTDTTANTEQIDQTAQAAQNQTTPAADSNSNAQSSNSDQTKSPEASANDFRPDENFAPLGGNKTQRSYSRPQVNPALQNTVIEEPVIVLDQSAETAKNVLSPPNTQTAKQEPLLPPAEGFNELSPNDKKLAAEKTVDLVLGAYDRLHWLGRKFVSVDMDDLADDHRRGEIDMNLEAFEDEENPENGITVKEYFEDFNKQVETEFVVTEDFKNSVRPPLERICMKRGWGASDELYLAFKFGEDIAMKTGLLIGFKKLTNKYMQEFKDDHQKLKARAQAILKKEREALEQQEAREEAMKNRLREEAAKKKADELAEKETKKESADLTPGA